MFFSLELYPQPIDREISKHLIDLGAYAVIGAYAHRVQTMEYYRGRPIIYGIGNFAFPHNNYMNGKLKFPSFTASEYIVEINDGKLVLHELLFDSIANQIRYVAELKDIDSSFSEMSNFEYEKWFKIHRYQKKSFANN